jgi:hypothetical protein
MEGLALHIVDAKAQGKARKAGFGSDHVFAIKGGRSKVPQWRACGWMAQNLRLHRSHRRASALMAAARAGAGRQ